MNVDERMKEIIEGFSKLGPWGNGTNANQIRNTDR